MIASQGQNNSLFNDIISLLSLVDFRLLNHSQTETGHLVCSLAHQSFHPSLWHTIPILSFKRVSPSYSSLKSGQDDDAAIGAFLDGRTSCHSVFSRAISSFASLVLISNHVHVAKSSKLVPILSRLFWIRALCSWTVVTEDDTPSGTDARWCLSRSTERSCSSEGCSLTDDGCNISLAKYPLPNGWTTPCCRAGIEFGSDSICTALRVPSSMSWAMMCWAINLRQLWSY